jgi:hypothetical protein
MRWRAAQPGRGEDVQPSTLNYENRAASAILLRRKEGPLLHPDSATDERGSRFLAVASAMMAMRRKLGGNASPTCLSFRAATLVFRTAMRICNIGIQPGA